VDEAIETEAAEPKRTAAGVAIVVAMGVGIVAAVAVGNVNLGSSPAASNVYGVWRVVGSADDEPDRAFAIANQIGLGMNIFIEITPTSYTQHVIIGDHVSERTENITWSSRGGKLYGQGRNGDVAITVIDRDTIRFVLSRSSARGSGGYTLTRSSEEELDEATWEDEDDE